MKHWAILAILVPVLIGCESPPPEPAIPTGIAVSPMEKGRLTGGRAHFAVQAPLSVALDVIIDFDRYAEFRPRVIEASSVAASQEGGQAFVKLRGDYGEEINAVCDYVISETDFGAIKVEYTMSDPSQGLWAWNGTLNLRSAGGGEWTVIDQEALLSNLSTNRQNLLDDLRADARAFQERIEQVAGTRLPDKN